MNFKALACAAVVSLIACAQNPSPAGAQNVAEIEAEISALVDRLAGFDAANPYPTGTALWALGEMERSILELNLAALESRRLAFDQPGGPSFSLPMVTPDPELAAEIGEAIAAQSEIVDAAEAEAEAASGLVAKLARTRALTEKLALAQLRMAYFQASYGVAYPLPPEVSAEPHDDFGAAAAGGAPPDWADPNHPGVDYASAPFPAFARQGRRFVGWWALKDGVSKVDDSAELSAINLSAPERAEGERSVLLAECVEQRPAVMLLTETPVAGGLGATRLQTVLRIDDETAERAPWSRLASGHGAGLFGAEALPLMRRMAAAETLFLRLSGGDGAKTDETFEMAGAARALEAVANTCGETTADLGRDGYIAVQQLLSGGGFYDGPADGVWGAASKEALRVFQEQNGLAANGAPDAETLEALGL